MHAGRVCSWRSWDIQQQELKSYDASTVVGKECGGRLPQPTLGTAGVL